MANKTIPNLGQVFTATDLDFLVITNSGETTTSKITRQDLLAGTDIAGGFIQGDASQSLVPYYFPTSAATAADTTYVDKLYSTGKTINGTNGSLLVGGASNTITSGSQTFVLGGSSNATQSTNFGVIGGSGNTAKGRGGNVFSTNVSNGEDLSTFYVNGGTYQTANAPGKNIVVVGGANHFWNTNGSGYGGIFGGNANKNRVSENTSVYQGMVMSVGGYRNLFGNGTWASPTSMSNSYMLSQLQSADTKITGDNSKFISAINTDTSTITSSTGTTIIGGDNVSITNKKGLIALGLSNRTPAYDDTTFVENSHTYKVESFDVIAAGNVGGTISVDLSLGTLFTFTLTGSSSVDMVNGREGQRVQFFVYSTGGHSITAITINSGLGSVYTANGNLPSPTNNGYTLYTGVIMGGNMILLEDKSLAAV